MWRARISWIAGLIVSLAVALAGSASARVNIPDWVRAAAAADPGKLPSQTKAVYLLQETNYNVTAPGIYTEHYRSVIKILRSEGRKYGDPLVFFQKSERVQSLHCWSIDSSGHEYELTDKDFVEKGLFDFLLYSDAMARSAKAPANQPGSVIALEYEVRHHEWINELGWTFQDEVPSVQTVLSIQFPAGWEYRTAWAFGSPVEPKETDPNRWEWRLTNVPGIEDDFEPMMPPAYVLAGRMSVAYFSPDQPRSTSASWQQVGEWYSGLLAGRASATPEIQAKVNQLIAGKMDFDSRLKALTLFLQSEIRYVAIEIGIGGNQPHAASDVFRYRYGDCKDKATLLKAMLEVAGIHSYLVLINSDRGFINPAVPSSWANHAILAIELPIGDESRYKSVVTTKSGKHFIIFDPTDEYTPVGSLRSELQNSYALIVTDSGGELIRTPLLSPDSNLVTRTGHFVLAPDGSLSGDVSVQDTGDFATNLREMLHYTDQRERDQLISRQIGRSLQGFSLQDIDVEKLNELQSDLLLSYKLSTPLYGQSRGPLMLVRPRVLGDKSVGVEHKPRHYPIELGRTAREVDTYEIELPKGYEVDDLPDGVNIDVGFASYRSKIQVEGSKLRYWREYVVRDVSIPPEKYDQWVKLQGVVGADEMAAAVLKRVP